MIKFYKLLGLTLSLLLLNSCASSSKKFSPESDGISVMAYNLENLFDTSHDKGTEDYSYLPITEKENIKHKRQCQKVRSKKYRRQCLSMDWNEEVLTRKMKRLADAILQVHDGRGPDLLIVGEVENIGVLQRLNKEYLEKSNYKTVVLIEGFDKRGIDVGMLSRLPLSGKPELHKIPFKGKNPEDQKWMNRSRGILQSTFILPDNQKLTAFAVHFPSPRNPRYWRKQAVVHLNKLMKALPKDHLAIAGGDFNISGSEESMYSDVISKDWLVSHYLGCHDCRGTNYYYSKRQWSFLDALLFEKDMHPKTGTSKWQVVGEKIGIPRDSAYQTNRFMSPARFEAESAVGVSDHWPIFAVIRPRKAQQKVK